MHGGPVYVDGIEVVIRIPYSGQTELWRMQPSTYDYNPPRAGVNGNELIIRVVARVERAKSTIPEGYKQTVESIRKYLGWQKTMIEQHNRRLPETVRQHVERRKRNLNVHTELDDIFDIPLARDPHAPSVMSIPIQRKVVKPLPPIPSAPAEKRYEVKEAEYIHILEIIRHEGRSFESTPGTYVKLGEEELRNIILGHLNTHYPGQATGETFRRKGKTDIRIEHEDRSAFVAECKNWSGPKTLRRRGQAVHCSNNSLIFKISWA
jgi:hypothetical protein